MKSQNIFFAFQVKGTVSQGFRSKHSTWVPYERAIELYCFRKMGNFCLKPCSYGARWCVLKIIIRVKISWFCPFTGIPVGLPYFFNMSEIYLRKKVTDYGRLVGTYIGYRYRIFLSSVTCGRSSCRAWDSWARAAHPSPHPEHLIHVVQQMLTVFQTK